MRWLPGGEASYFVPIVIPGGLLFAPTDTATGVWPPAATPEGMTTLT